MDVMAARGQFDQEPLGEAIMGRGQKKDFHARLALIRSMLIGIARSNHAARHWMHAERRVVSDSPARSIASVSALGKRELSFTVRDRPLDLVLSHAARRASSETRTSRTRNRATHGQLAAAVEGRGS